MDLSWMVWERRVGTRMAWPTEVICRSTRLRATSRGQWNSQCEGIKGRLCGLLAPSGMIQCHVAYVI